MGNTTTRITKSLRFEILKRDGHKCQYCGAEAPETKLQVDHVIPVSLGGQNTPDNLIAACIDCNSGKGRANASDQAVADVSEFALRWAQAMRKAAADQREYFEQIRNLGDEFQDLWYDTPTKNWNWDLPNGWRDSILKFYDIGMTYYDFTHFVRITAEKVPYPDDPFRYFCGCMWKEHAHRLEMAKAYIESGQV